jgi:hypothetical protein
MGWKDRLRHVTDSMRWDGTTGAPRSSNGASSFHLAWESLDHRWVAADATLQVVVPPTVPVLYFWALQVSFVDEGRRNAGGAHLGLQWFPPHPRSAAVNWGGYAPAGGELAGSPSALPSATDNVNTRDYGWLSGRAYRLRVELAGAAPGGQGQAWRGSVTDSETGQVTVVRDLYAAGTHLASPMVWSEVFADCDAPSVTVRWSDLALTDDSGRVVPVTQVRTNYQAPGDGGCSITDSRPDGSGFLQITNTPRTNPGGARLVLR